jgi:hypothetical protein
MLRRRLVPILVGLVVLSGLVVSASSALATVDAPVLAMLEVCPGGTACCPDTNPNCTIHDHDPGTPSDPGSPGDSGSHKCTWQGQVVPCSTAALGYYIGDGCYIRKIEPPPAAGPPGGNPEGRTGGAWYVKSCYFGSTDMVTQLYVWYWDTPAIPPNPEDVARDALATIRLDGAAVGFAPNPGGSGLVGLPVWMWTEQTPNTWGPISASATDAGLTVNITARATQIVWDMGNGDAVTCANPGLNYDPSYGRASSPMCGYTYRVSSRNQPGGKYAVTATTTWRVDWEGGGENGVITTTRTSNTTVQIDELQVVVG